MVLGYCFGLIPLKKKKKTSFYGFMDFYGFCFGLNLPFTKKFLSVITLV